MQSIQKIIDTMSPSIEIVGFEESISYRCDKCSNKSENGEVRHPKAIFNVIEPSSWNLAFGEPFIYILTATLKERDVESPRYVGISKAKCLMRRWTRLPKSEKNNYSDGTLIHHMPATIPRLQRDFSDPNFQARGGHFRLRAASISQVINRMSALEREKWLLPDAASSKLEDQYATIKQLEKRVESKFYSLGLSPWNKTRNNTAALSFSILEKKLTIASTWKK